MDETAFFGLVMAVFFIGVIAFIIFFIRMFGEPNPSEAQLNAADLPAFPQPPPAGMGMVYVLRPSRMAMAMKYSIRLDDRTPAGEVARLGARSYVAIPVSPGAHALFASTLEKNDEMPFEIAAGQTLAFITRPGMGAVLQTARIVAMDERAARFHCSKIPAGKLSASPA